MKSETVVRSDLPVSGILTVERDNADDEADAQHHDDERVDFESGALVSVELEHCRAAAASTGGASARGTGIGDFVGAVGGCATADGSCRASRGFGRGGACGCAARGGGRDGRVGRLRGHVVNTRAGGVDIVVQVLELRTIVMVSVKGSLCFFSIC